MATYAPALFGARRLVESKVNAAEHPRVVDVVGDFLECRILEHDARRIGTAQDDPVTARPKARSSTSRAAPLVAACPDP